MRDSFFIFILLGGNESFLFSFIYQKIKLINSSNRNLSFNIFLLNNI